jgi:hypothetical protein
MRRQLPGDVHFNYFSSNLASGSAFLHTASQFEKWICAVLRNAVMFPCIFLLFFRLVKKPKRYDVRL